MSFPYCKLLTVHSCIMYSQDQVLFENHYSMQTIHFIAYQCWLGAIHVWNCPSGQNIHKTVNNYWLLNSSITKASLLLQNQFQKSFCLQFGRRRDDGWLVCENLVSYASFQAFIFIDYCESCYEERGDNRMKTVDWREQYTQGHYYA